MRAFLLSAGRGLRFRPVTERIPKPLIPFLNVPHARAVLARLRAGGISEAAVNLHHLGEQVQKYLVDAPAELPQLRFFPERELLGTAGALRNAAEWLMEDGEDFLVVNSDAAIEPDLDRLVRRHRAGGRPATLLAAENREPERYTPLQTEGDRITGFGRKDAEARESSPGGSSPLLYTGVCVLSRRLLERIPPGERSLVSDLWEPLLAGGEEIGWVAHDGPFADLGTPRDLLRASLEALARGGPFRQDAGAFDERTRTLSRDGEAAGAGAARRSSSVIGRSRIGAGAQLLESVVWDGVTIGEGARLEGCIAASGVVPSGAAYRNALLWAAGDGPAAVIPL